MNKVITINLGGNAYQLEEGGYDALRAYLETATARLAGNPDREEILSDIERAIADKFRALLASHKTVVEAKEVAAVLADMGPIEADSGEAREQQGAGAAGVAGSAGGTSGAGAAGEARASASSGPPRRLYRIHEGAMLAGVCNGIAAYANLDPTLVRIGFVLLTIFWGTGLLVYVVMAIVVPEAVSPEEKSAASGIPATAQEFIRRAKEGYYEAMKNFPDRKARREWQRKFKREMRANADQWRHNWYSYWAERAPVHPGMGFALPFLSLLNGAALILFMCTLFSVLATGSVFGRPLPGDLPVWGAAVVLLLVYGILAGPLKLARRACYRGMGPPGWSWSLVFLMDAVIWLGVVAVLVFLAVHYFPDVRDAFHSLPSLVHQAVDDIRTWWNQK
ncbi:MAG TPA: PspC domain-containing protein [Verrucomicrobiae bacterium]|jgi:phage shock protein PspC (stress-responsive transcriptional regulator)|nr:PspC domain-containing protein [Verrucomicrobiae bacterium]